MNSQKNPAITSDIRQVLEELSQQVANAFSARKLKLSAAESCSGGWLSHCLVSLSGASDFFLGSVVSYSDSAKTALLGVEKTLLEKHGAVSEQVAIAMAEGAKNKFSSNIALSITGIAGPSGATKDKSVGTVFIGIAGNKNSKAQLYNFSGDRTEIRYQSVKCALELLLRYMETAQP